MLMNSQPKKRIIIVLLVLLFCLSIPTALQCTGLADLQNAVTTESITDATGGQSATIKNTDFVVLRELAQLESTAVCVIAADEKLQLIAREGDWVKVSCSKGTGYMRSWYFNQEVATTTNSQNSENETTTSVVAPPVAVTTTDDVTTSTPTPAQTPATTTTSPTTIKSGTKVLAIGDSHSVGIYGTELDKLLRATGASVRSVGVSGSSPSWWWNGTVTKSGYVDRKADGSKDQPKDWRSPRATPAYSKLLQEHQPDMVIISLGANMLGSSASKIQSDCGRLITEARNAGAQVVWVGPPDARSAERNKMRGDFYQTMASVANGQATLIDSRKFTKYPASGGDGTHYWGSEGSATARKWAQKVLEEIQAR
jgi:hypothetical protein